MKKKDELLQEEGMDESKKGIGVLDKEGTMPGEEESGVKTEDLPEQVDLPTKEELSTQEEHEPGTIVSSQIEGGGS